MTEGIQKPNCSNCSLATCYVLDASKIPSSDPNHDPFPMVYACKIKNGKWMQADDVCLEHPKAQEYLMQDVIQELERRMSNRVFVISIRRMITLLKGVKK